MKLDIARQLQTRALRVRGHAVAFVSYGGVPRKHFPPAIRTSYSSRPRTQAAG